MINYVTADGLDTPRVVTSPAGSVIWSWSIKGNPFGDKVPSALSGYAYNLRFPGQYYDAETGRYRQADPVGFAGGQWSLYGYVNGNPLAYTDPQGLYFGLDDAAAAGLGAVVGLASQGFSDLIGGRLSSWQDYAGSAIGGAASGWSSLYLGPLATGAVFGGVTNLSKQSLKMMTDKQCSFDAGSLAVDTALGAGLGKIAGPQIEGITSGRGSYSAIFKQMVAKRANGTISNISPQTAMKMAASKQAEDLSGTAAGPIISAVADTLASNDGQCGCQ